MLNVKKTFALAIISLFIGLIAYSTAASITSSTNGTNFTFNLSGQPAMDNFSTIVCGVNMTCSQNSTPDNHTIYINSLGAGGGGGSGTVTQLNQGAGITLSPSPITTTGTIQINGSACNPANQASVLNSSGGLECVSNIDTGIGAEVDPFSPHWDVFANAVHNNESEPSFNANYSNLVNVTNNSYVLRNGTWSRANITIDKNVDTNYNLNMSGNLSIGNNSGSYGFSQNYITQYGSLINYYDPNGKGSYIGLTENAQYNVIEGAWHKMNKTKGSMIMQAVVFNESQAGGLSYGLDLYGSKSTPIDPFVNFDVVALFRSTGITFGNIPITSQNLAGNNKNITCIRADGTLYSGKINLLTGTCDY